MANKYKKGYYLEYKLKNELQKVGFWCTRLPKSGSRTVPLDVIAVKNKIILGFECKRRKEKIYLRELDLDKLLDWEKITGGKSFICIYFDNEKKIRIYETKKLLEIDKKIIDISDTNYLSFRQFINSLFSFTLF